MKNLIIIPFLFLFQLLISQNNKELGIHSSVINENDNSMKIEYNLYGDLHLNRKTVSMNEMFIPFIKGCGYLQQTGKPALPIFTEIFAVNSVETSIRFESKSRDTIENIIIYPWIGHHIDVLNGPTTEFLIDTAFYLLNTYYPIENASSVSQMSIRGQQCVLVRICPFTYNPAEKRLIIHRKFTVEMEQNKPTISKNVDSPSEISLSILNNILLNKKTFNASKNADKLLSQAQNYLIITHPHYMDAALKLSQWREQTGYATDIICNSYWNPDLIRQTILSKYYGPKRPAYILLLGDHNKVPGASYISWHGIFPSDRLYVFMGGGNDYFADIAIGRISVNSEQQANEVVEKLVNYEKYPVNSSAFYSNAMCAAYFQDDDNDNYADRRFAQTAEEILRYLTDSIGKTVSRVYFTESSITPLYWNNDNYSAGEPVPLYLRKPGFPWTGNANDIRNGINEGRFLIFHRDHGSDAGWAEPAFNLTNIASLTNGNKLPVVASVNCQTGRFITPVCFAEAFLRHQLGGTVGIFAHAEVSFSGYNDALSMGIADAIFPQPGLTPNFTGSGHITGTITPMIPIYTLGDITDQALLRMTQTWGDDWELEEYQHIIFHFLGDPATRIFTQEPVQITATHPHTIHCSDSLFQISSSNIPDALATLTADNSLIGMTTLQNGNGLIHFQPTASNQIILTISAPNTIPYIQNVNSSGNCLYADFITDSPEFPCVSSDVTFKNTSTGYYTSLFWNFGADASPQTFTGTGTHTVQYSLPGIKTVSLIAFSPSGNDTAFKTIFVDSNCLYVMPEHGEHIIQQCQGVIRDNGNDSPYLSNSNVNTLIYSPGAAQFLLSFDVFDVQPSFGCSDNYIQVFSGKAQSGQLLGTYCNNNQPPPQLIINNDSIEIVFHSEQNTGYQGFEIEWSCQHQQIAPVAQFNFVSTDLCNGTFSFQDISIHQPDTWYWDFGDGNNSTLQHPMHEYFIDGTYDVQLIASNAWGSSTLHISNCITVNRADALSDTVISVCRPGIVQIPGGGNQKVFWFENMTDVLPIAYTDTLVMPVSDSVTHLFCRNYETGFVFNAGKTDNSGPGGYFNSSVVQFLGFDVYQPVKLNSVTVYAQNNGNRTITIKNGNGDIVFTSTQYLTTGMNVVQLNCILLPDNDYSIDAGQFCMLYRNGESGGNNLDYPFISQGGIISVNRSSAGYPYASTFYYYFYNWELETLCFSAPASKEIRVQIPDTTVTVWSGTSFCLADSILLTCNPDYSITWIPGNFQTNHLFAHHADTYYALIENNGCNAVSNQIILTGEQMPHANFTYSPSGLNVNFSNLSTGNNFHWSFGDGSFSTDQHPVHTYSSFGSYVVVLISQNSCGSDTLTLQINITDAGISDVSPDDMFVYPNPVRDYLHFNINTKTKVQNIQIVNTFGQMVDFSIPENSNDMPKAIFVGDLPQGMYLFIVTDTDHQYFARFIKINE